MNCSGCGLTLAEGDLFCGNCGRPVPAGEQRETQPSFARPREPWPTVSTRMETAAGDDGQHAPIGDPAMPGRFFHHAAARPAGRPTNPTRYLCAAAYLNPWYANWVIGELLVSHRAVAPSVDADLGPIIRHCLHARRIALIRDLALTAILLTGLIVAPAPAILVLVIALGLGFLRGPAWQRRSAGAKFAIAATVAAVILGAIVVVAVISLISHLGQVFGGATPGSAGTGSSPVFLMLKVVLFLLLAATPTIIHTRAKFRTLSERLRPGAAPMRFTSANPQVEARIAQVEAAQWGNVTLYSGENPFIGTGGLSRTWSIAIELDRARPAGQEFSLRPVPRGYVPIDPVELHHAIRERLLRLNDPGLPGNERISALTVEDHVVGEGLRGWDSPLIDPERKIPYSLADEEAIEALIRHPQAGLRYYQRVSVSDKGQPVLSHGRKVIAGADQEVAVSAFVYVAVEGRMFYLEFVTTVMPPILERYHIIDRLPKISSGAFMAKVVQESASTMLGDLLSAPFRAFGTVRQLIRESSSLAQGGALDSDYLFSDVGVRKSARGLGAAPSPRTYIQTLDVTKYTKIVERLLTDTVLDFLRAKGVDTTAYAASASTIINGPVTNIGENYGAVAAGAGASASQAFHGPPPAPPPAAAAG